MRFLIYFLIILVSGCATMEHLDELLTLKNVSDNQKDMDIYLKKQIKGFKKLLDDIKNDRLRKGESKNYIISTYYDPILTKQVGELKDIREVLLYRHPTEYFNSDRVYLYINNKGRLAYWEVKPAESQQQTTK